MQFVKKSSAGFFVGEVKLSREMLLKNIMVIGGKASRLSLCSSPFAEIESSDLKISFGMF